MYKIMSGPKQENQYNTYVPSMKENQMYNIDKNTLEKYFNNVYYYWHTATKNLEINTWIFNGISNILFLKFQLLKW